MNISKSERSAADQLRFGILETGRFVGEDEVDRICLFCNTNSIENDIHSPFIVNNTLHTDRCDKSYCK